MDKPTIALGILGIVLTSFYLAVLIEAARKVEVNGLVRVAFWTWSAALLGLFCLSALIIYFGVVQ